MFCSEFLATSLFIAADKNGKRDTMVFFVVVEVAFFVVAEADFFAVVVFFVVDVPLAFFAVSITARREQYP